MSKPLRIFLSSPSDVRAAREIAALTIERLAQDYARFFKIEPYLWEFEPMDASGHFQDLIEPPSAFDIVVIIVWSRLGTPLPERYHGIDGRAPVTGTEWEFEEALQAAQHKGAPDLLVYRSMKPASLELRDPNVREQQLEQLQALETFWSRHFANQGIFLGAYTTFATDGEFASSLENHLHKLIEKRIASLASSHDDEGAKIWKQAPFRGLEAYEFEHAPIYFGQDEALSTAMLQFSASADVGLPFLLVLGASGSGKSSLVRAGVLPKLFVPRRIAGLGFVRRVLFRPSDARADEDLFDALARRLALQTGEREGMPELIGPGQSLSNLAAHLRGAAGEAAYPIGTALGQIATHERQAGRLLENEAARLVLVIDQLEELFTNERIELEERRRFIDLLAGLVRSGFVWVAATMRNDYWHCADETPDLVRLSEGNRRLELLPPSPAQLSQIIRRPVEAAGISFELHGTTSIPLNEEIAEEVAREPGALPLLSYLLDQLYRADVLDGLGKVLTYATYERLGKLEGAIATKAEEVLAGCASEDRQALGAVLFRLVQLGMSADIEHAIARRVPLSSFVPGTPQRRLVDALIRPDARLLVSDAEWDGSPTVRVAHEALFTRWSRAREIVRNNAEALKIQSMVEERLARYRDVSQHKKNPNGLGALLQRLGLLTEVGLLRDLDLSDAQRLAQDHEEDIAPNLSAFIQRSTRAAKRDRNLVIRSVSAVAIVMSLLGIGATIEAIRAWHYNELTQTAADVSKVSHEQLKSAERSGDAIMLGRTGDLPELARTLYGLEAHLASIMIAFDPNTPVWRHDLAASDARIGWVLTKEGKAHEALPYLYRAKAISETLVHNEPTNSDWQTDLKAAQALLKGAQDAESRTNTK